MPQISLGILIILFFNDLLGNNSILLSVSVDAIVGLAHPADGAANGVRLVRAGHAAGGLINIGDVQLNGGVILGRNDAVARRAEKSSFISIINRQNPKLNFPN